jgi:hypothetical protein
MPIAEVVGVPAIAGGPERTGLAARLRLGLRDVAAVGVGHRRAGGRVGHRDVVLGAARGVLDAVVVVEVADTTNAGLAMVVVELVVTGRGALKELQGAPQYLSREFSKSE